MKRKREAAVLLERALASLRRSVQTFNSFDDQGRQSAVLRDLQHAHEMLLKAALVQRSVKVFDKRTGQSLAFEKCVRLGTEHLGLDDGETGTFRGIDALRDEQQHWFADVSEGLLYLHTRAGLTLFDDVLGRVFDDQLANHLPHRVLPLSAEPPRDIQLLIDEEFSAIQTLLAPGRRRNPEARARIRTLLAMEAHTAEEVKVSKNDVDRVQRGIRAHKTRSEVFPRLASLDSSITGEGIQVKVRFVKSAGVAPVRLVAGDDPTEAAAIREVDLSRKYHRTAADLAESLKLTLPRSVALRRYLDIDSDPDCTHTFKFGSQRHVRYSDNAFTRMRDALDGGLDMASVWGSHRPRHAA
jgi:hypothetical protein